MYLKKRNWIFLGLMITFIKLFAQYSILDMVARYSLVAKYDINKRQYLSGMFRFKMLENFTELDSWRVDIGYGYKFSPSLKISVHYSFNPEITTQNYYRNIHRYYLRADYHYFINKYLTIQNRVIFQHFTHRFLTDIQDNGYKPYYRTDIRERIGFSYNISARAAIYLQDEVMYNLSECPLELKRNRIYLGYEKKVNKKWTTKVYFIVQSSLHRNNSPNRHYFIFGWDWILNFN